MSNQSVEKFRTPKFKSRLAVALGADTVDYVVAVQPFRKELQNHFRRILQIGVDDNHGVPGRVFQPGRYRDLVAEIPGQSDQADSGVVSLQVSQDVQGGIRA